MTWIGCSFLLVVHVQKAIVHSGSISNSFLSFRDSLSSIIAMFTLSSKYVVIEMLSNVSKAFSGIL